MFIFLMCSERSGSNFITKLMNGHPDIVGPSPKHIINPVARNLFRYGNLEDDTNWNELVEDIYKLFEISFSEWKSEITLEKLKNLGKNKKIDSLIKNIFIEEAKANNAQHIFIKENQIYEFTPFLMNYFPEAKYIYSVRDPRDMALSWKKNPSHKGGVVAAAKQWKTDQANFLKNYYVLEQRGQAFFVKYEELISDTEKYTNNICDFLGVEYSPQILEFYKDELTINNSKKQGAWNNLSKGVLSDNSKKYLKDLTEEEIKIIENICYYEMNILGYETEYSREELDKVTENIIKEKQDDENASIDYNASELVKENMDAKKKFYCRTLN